MNNIINSCKIYAMATDPIYIGTGGYTIGRVDNTIIRDPITNIPKIPGSSLAGTWRYYTALKLQSYFKDEYKMDRKKRKDEKIEDLFDNPPNNDDWVKGFEGNRYAAIKCAGKDDRANQTFEDATEGSINKDTGHCGHCIVCKTFGYSKNNRSHQGLAYFSDLNILFFPVSTRLGVRWVTSPIILKTTNFNNKITISKKENNETHLNLGWIYLEIGKEINLIDTSKINIEENIKTLIHDKLILVSDDLIAQIINSNLEVRTSVSIDPLTGAAKEGALFTSEAIPRGTIFYGEIRVIDRNAFDDNDKLPKGDLIFKALDDSKHFYETLGIGGMVTRGFGRMEVHLAKNQDNNQQKKPLQNGGQNG